MFTSSQATALRCTKNRCAEQPDPMRNKDVDSPNPVSFISKGCNETNREAASSLIESQPPCPPHEQTEINQHAASNYNQLGHLNSVVLHPNPPLEDFQGCEVDGDNSLHHPTNTLSHLAQKRIQRGGGSESYQNAATLLAAVSTPSDAYTAFEQELLDEINQLRCDPAFYAVLFENEATLGYPFICMEDEYYATDAAASNAHEYHPESLLEAVSRVTRTACPHGREEISLFLSSRIASEPQANHQSNEHIITQSKNQKTRPNSLMQQVPPIVSTSSCPGSEPLSTRSSSKGRGRSARASAMTQHRLNKSNASASGQGAHLNVHSSATSSAGSPQPSLFQAANDATVTPSTLKKQGLTEMTLEQLGTHLRRHELHRFALERAAEDILIRWQLAQLALQDASSVEDDRISKRGGKGQHVTSKEGMTGCTLSSRAGAFPQTGSHRKSHERATSSEGVHQQRFEVAEKLRSIFAAHLRAILEKICLEHLICKRSMDGANLILDCVQALRQVSPVPPLLPRRGLYLAARSVSLFHHALGDCVSKAPASSSSNMLLSPCSANLRDGREVKLLPLLSSLQDNLPMSIQEGGDVKPVHVLKEWVKSQKNQATNFFNANTQLLAHRISVEAIAKDITCIAHMAHEACGKYGQIANQLRGIQVYGSGKAREVIIRAILGVLIPQFVIHGVHFPEAIKRDSTETVDRLLTDREISRLFKFSIFSGTSRQGGTDRATAPEANNISDEAHDEVEYTGIMLCGTYHPTTMGALVQRLLEQDSDPTSRGKRVVAAAHRLGPLLWRDARVVGIGWQRACRPLTYDEPDQCIANTGGPDEKDRSQSSDYICTTIVLATEYEELELIAMNKHASLEEVNRIVQQCQELNNLLPENFSLPILDGCSVSTEGISAMKDISQMITSTTVADLPVMVDLHSNLGVQILHPRCHPLMLEVDFTSHHSGVAVVVLRADRRRVQVRASLSAYSAINPSSWASFPPPEMQASPEVLIQRSVVDRDVVLIMIDTMSVTNEFLQVMQTPDSDSSTAISYPLQDTVRFLHIFEKPIKGRDIGPTKTIDVVTGYSFIGFIRLVFQAKTKLSCRNGMVNHSPRKLLVSSDGKLRSTACATPRGSAIQAALGLRSTEVSTLGARKGRSHRNERIFQAGGASVARGGIFLPPLYEAFLAHFDFSARAAPLEYLHDGLPALDGTRDALFAAVAGTCSGWPDISAEFTDRGGCILSPLVSTLLSDSGNTPVRFAVYLPNDYQNRGIALQQKEALLELLRSLEEIEAAEALKESTDIALMQEETQNQIDTPCESDAESREKAGTLSRQVSSHGDGNAYVTAGTEIQLEEAVSASACASADGEGTHADSTFPTLETIHQKAELGRSKKGPGKNIVDDRSSSPGGNKRSKKEKSPDERRTGSPNLRAEQKGSKLHLRRNGSLSTLKQSVPRELVNPAVARLQGSSLVLFEDGNIDLFRLFDAPPSNLGNAAVKQTGSIPQALTHNILMSMSLARLRNLVDEQARLLGERRALLIRIEGILCDELQRLEAEVPKRKGRELIKLKRDEEDINLQLEQMRAIVQNYEKEAQHSKEVLTRRTRDQMLRRARLKHVKAHLAALCGSGNNFEDGTGSNDDPPLLSEVGEPLSLSSSPYDVNIWFVPKNSLPHALRVSSQVFPINKTHKNAACAPGLMTTQAPITTSANNIVHLMRVELPGQPQSYCYEATVQVPSSLHGCAVLLVNGYKCALWEL
ncbi:unnamed protein product [Phytomonas sp. EM1]|nr:unnamed protein product [Phytomonas sp. EM1]|eukprot:CCW63629.1 unnamed protein product [Phytomonas sp. isolate EM1]